MCGTKLEKFLPKNKHTLRKYSIVRIGLVGASEVSKIRVLKVYYFHLLSKKIPQIEIKA